MLELFNTAYEFVKKNKDAILIYISLQFISNSTTWFNFKNLIKLFSFCLKKSLDFATIVGIQTKSVFAQTSVAIKQSKETMKEKVQFSSLLLIVGGFLILLKLHNAGIIKLNSNTVIAISAMVLMMGLLSVISKMDFTKAEIISKNN